VSLEISANTCSWEKCAPLLGTSILGFVSTLLCARFYGGGGLSLEEYSKGLVGFSSLVEKGFPVYFLCTCTWCFFL
jgi:hypothetical protein